MGNLLISMGMNRDNPFTCTNVTRSLFLSLSYSTHHQCFFLSLQALGGVLIGVGAWLEIQEQTIVQVVDQQVFLAGPYLLIAAGCCIVIVAVIGMIGAFCDKKINRFLLVLVSEG